MADAEVAPPARAAASKTRQDLAFVYASYAFRYLYLLVLVPFYARVLGAVAYGGVLAAMSLMVMVWMIADYGFVVAGTRDAAGLDGDRAALGRLYGRHMSGRLVATVAAALLGAGGTVLSPVLAADPKLGMLATLAGIASGFSPTWIFQGTSRFRTSVLLELLGFTISLPLILAFVAGPADGWVILGSLLVSSSATNIIGHALALRLVDLRSIRCRGGISLVRETTALFAAKATGMIMTSSSTYLVSVLASAAEVGWYGSAERIAGAALSLTGPAYQVLVSTICRRLGDEATRESAFDMIGDAVFLLSCLGIVMCLGTLVIAGVLVPMILGPGFGPATTMLRVLGFMFPFATVSQVISSCVLIPLRMDVAVTKVNFAAMLATLVLTLVLGHFYAGVGIAWSRVLGYVVMAVLAVDALRRQGLLTSMVTRSLQSRWAFPRRQR